MCYNNNWPLASIANTYLRRAADHYRQVRAFVGAPKCTCKLLGKEKAWRNPPDVVTTFLFGLYPPPPHTYKYKPHPYTYVTVFFNTTML